MRLSIYDSLTSAPRVVELSSRNYIEFIHELAGKTYEFSQSKGGKIPFSVIKELAENLVHAYFKDAVITIMNDGNTIRFSDQGPGIRNKEKAFLPGFTTATKDIRKHIKGVGSGLPIVKESLMYIGGQVTVEDNLDQGTVVTLSVTPEELPRGKPRTPRRRRELKLNDRQKGILLLIGELGEAGPSIVSRELDISLSTAHRELSFLEDNKLLQCQENGKRVITEEGIAQMGNILRPE